MAEGYVPTVVLGCVDKRFFPGGIWAKPLATLFPGSYHPTFAGAVRPFLIVEERPSALVVLKATMSVVGLKARLVVINHHGCGRYAKDGFSFSSLKQERDHHVGDMAIAVSILQEHFRGSRIERWYAEMRDGKGVITQVG